MNGREALEQIVELVAGMKMTVGQAALSGANLVARTAQVCGKSADSVVGRPVQHTDEDLDRSRVGIQLESAERLQIGDGLFPVLESDVAQLVGEAQDPVGVVQGTRVDRDFTGLRAIDGPEVDARHDRDGRHPVCRGRPVRERSRLGQSLPLE